MTTVIAVDTERMLGWIKAIDFVLQDKMLPVMERVELRKTRSDLVSALGRDPKDYGM